MDCDEVFDKIMMVLVLVFITMSIGFIGIWGYFLIKILREFAWF